MILYLQASYIVLAALLFTGSASFTLQASASSEGPGITAEQALERLKTGNQNFVQQHRLYPHQQPERLQKVAQGQEPIATIITCSDSRVPPEHIFDAGFGDLFIIRVAGNVCDTDEIGSIEYGVEHLGTPLMIVMGHSQCGAVQAVVTHAEVHGSIPDLVDNIVPAVERVKEKHPNLEGEELLAHSVEANVWKSIEDLLYHSHGIRERIREDQVQVVGAIYHIDDGKVQWLGSHPRQQDILSNYKGGDHVNGASFIHNVFFWMKDGTTQEDINQLIQDCKKILGSIETVSKLEVGIPAGTEREVVDGSYAVNLIIHFDDKEGHDLYQTHEKHLEFIERNREHWERVQVYDTIKK